ELRLGDAVGESRARGDPLRQRQRLLLKCLGVDKFVEEAPLLSFLRAHGAAGEQQLSSAALTYDARQYPARAHVAAGEANAIEQEGNLRLRRRQTQIGSHRDDGARAGGDAVDGCNNRLAAMKHS